MNTELGISLPFDGLPLHEHREAIASLEAAGYSGLWTGEVNGADGLAPLAAFAAWQPAMSVSCAVVSAFTRGPALQAMSAATLADIAPGRARYGIGAGSDVIVERWNGVPFDSPYSRVDDLLRFLREVLTNGQADTVPTTFQSEGFKLTRLPEQPPKLVVAALGPKMQRLAAAEADGVVLNFLSAADIEIIKAEAGKTDRRVPGPFEVSARVFLVPGENERSETTARRHIAGYLTVPVYAAFQEWLGRSAALEDLWRLWADGDRKGATAAIPDDVVDSLVITGDPERCAAGIQRYIDAGLDAVTVLLLPPQGGMDATEQVEFLCRVGDVLRNNQSVPTTEPNTNQTLGGVS